MEGGVGDGGASGGARSIEPLSGYEHLPDDPMEGVEVAARPGLMAASGSGGSSEGGSPSSSVAPMTMSRKRKATLIPSAHALLFPDARPRPGTKDFVRFLPEFRWSTPPPAPQPREFQETRPKFRTEGLKMIVGVRGSKELQEAMEPSTQRLLERAKLLEEMDEDKCDREEDKPKFRAFKKEISSLYRKLAAAKPGEAILNHKPPSDTLEEVLTAEEMEMKARLSRWPVCPQAQHFATIALEHYNSNKKYKFDMATVLLSKCFSEADGTTIGHVNFTASSLQRNTTIPVKRLFFAELMLIPNLQLNKCTEPMRVLHVCTIDDSCFGGCHEMVRNIKEPIRKDLDYSRCHACSDRIKHPRGELFVGGHNRTRMPYFTLKLSRSWA